MAEYILPGIGPIEEPTVEYILPGIGPVSALPADSGSTLLPIKMNKMITNNTLLRR